MTDNIKMLTNDDFIEAAKILNVSPAVIKAVASVESRGKGFYNSGRPVILFEAHIFGKYTQYKYNTSHPNISSKKWNKKLYYGGEREFDRLNEAVSLDEAAALKSASWGKFQIMGFNYGACGYPDVFKYVEDQYISEGKHLVSFINFIQYNKLDKYLRSLDWAGFAKRYNGPKYAENKYDIKLKLAYEKYMNE